MDSPHWWSRKDGVEAMAMPQRDDTIEAIKRLDALLEYAFMHGDEEEAARLREELRKLPYDWPSLSQPSHRRLPQGARPR